ncbi:MAG: UDP-N-acetylmuramoyl-L-alanyl-D-glutamate--L-lysine ligase [Planctomycetota bacterium]|jgi:UDP-N-acetylmuramoyl-L-alanyl-D-glutamate--2,6-diaminopimelate ligase
MVAYESAPLVDLSKLWPAAHFVLSGVGKQGMAQVAGLGDEFYVSRCVDRASNCLPGDTFVAMDLGDVDTHEEAEAAVAAGASMVVCERLLPLAVAQCLVDDSRQAWGELCHALEGFPCEDLITVAIAGTHGKTTLNLLTSSLMKAIGKRVAYRNTIGTSDGATLVPAIDAQVDCPKSLAKWLTGAVAQQVPAAVIEIDSLMLYNSATSGALYDLLVITSLRSDVSTGNATSKQLQRAMQKQIQQLKPHGIVLYNADDASLSRWIKSLGVPAMSYGIDAEADVKARVIEREVSEQTLMISAGRMVMPLRSALVGKHNARHLLAAVTAGYVLGLELSEVIGGVERLPRVPGRMQRVEAGQSFSVFVDQADSADRLAVALHALRQHSTGRVLCVMDASGNVSNSMLATIGKVLERNASEVCLTHSLGGTFQTAQENSFAILDGFDDPALPHILPDRDRAIEWILQRAKPGDAILLAGCGDGRWFCKRTGEATSDVQSASYWLRQPVGNSNLVQSGNEKTSSLFSIGSQLGKPKLKLFRPES